MRIVGNQFKGGIVLYGAAHAITSVMLLGGSAEIIFLSDGKLFPSDPTRQRPHPVSY